MLIGQALILGIIQGITEFLPISSSGHLIVLPSLFQWPDQGLAFDAILHLGTLLAVVIYFRHELWQIVRAFCKPKNTDLKLWRRLGWLLLLATIPAAFFGIIFEDIIAVALRSTTVVAVSLLVWAIVMLFAENYSKRFAANNGNIQKITLLQAIVVGFWQVIALIPGTSRSGITMIGGMFAGLSREMAVKFSFLLSVPVIAGAGLVSLIGLLRGSEAIDYGFLASGFFAAAISGYIAIAILLKIVKTWGFKPFVAYRIILALLLLLFL